jgi:hypothetical protein
VCVKCEGMIIASSGEVVGLIKGTHFSAALLFTLSFPFTDAVAMVVVNLG